MDGEYDEEKLAELILLVADRLRHDRSGGAIKLNKVIFFAEFTHLRRYHRAISGCEFQRLDHGPAPRRLVPVRQRLLDTGAAEFLAEDKGGRVQQRLLPTRPPDRSCFDDEELATIDEVIKTFSELTASEISELSHQEPGWQLTENGETIPAAAAFLGYPQIATEASDALELRVMAANGLTPGG